MTSQHKGLDASRYSMEWIRGTTTPALRAKESIIRLRCYFWWIRASVAAMDRCRITIQ